MSAIGWVLAAGVKAVRRPGRKSTAPLRPQRLRGSDCSPVPLLSQLPCKTDEAEQPVVVPEESGCCFGHLVGRHHVIVPGTILLDQRDICPVGPTALVHGPILLTGVWLENAPSPKNGAGPCKDFRGLGTSLRAQTCALQSAGVDCNS
jgi:hypothetical protein